MREIWTTNEGQGLTEYSLILGFVALLIITALSLLGDNIIGLFKKVTDSWPQ